MSCVFSNQSALQKCVRKKNCLCFNLAGLCRPSYRTTSKVASLSLEELSNLASSQLQALYDSLPSQIRPHIDSVLPVIQRLLPHQSQTKPTPGLAEKLTNALTQTSFFTLFVTVVGPFLILVFSMSRWVPSGRYSPFSNYSFRGPPRVTEDDFDYLSGEDDRHHPRHNSHQHSHHHDQHESDPYDHPHRSSRADHADLVPDVLILKHKGTTYPLHFPAFSIAESLKVGDLRRAAAKETGCDDPRRVKLLYKGRSLRNDAAYCHQEGLKQNSELICVISSDAPLRNPDDDNESSSSASSSAIANGVETSDPGDGRSKRKNHRGGSKRKNRENRELRNSIDPRYERDSRAERDVRPERDTRPERDPRYEREPRYERDANPRSSSSNLVPPSSSTGNIHQRPRSPSRAPTPGRQPQQQQQPPPKPAPTTPAETIAFISHAFEHEYLPQVRALLDNPPTDPKTRQFESKRLSETILTKVLFKLDEVQTEDDAVKAKRKECVKEANYWSQLLDKLEKGEK